MVDDKNINEVIESSAFIELLLVFYGYVRYLFEASGVSLVGGVVLNSLYPRMADKLVQDLRTLSARFGEIHRTRIPDAYNYETVIVRDSRNLGRDSILSYLDCRNYLPIFITGRPIPQGTGLANIISIGEDVLHISNEELEQLKKILKSLKIFVKGHIEECLRVIRNSTDDIDCESSLEFVMVVVLKLMSYILSYEGWVFSKERALDRVQDFINYREKYNDEIFARLITAECLFDYLYLNSEIEVLGTDYRLWKQDERRAYELNKAIFYKVCNKEEYYFIPEKLLKDATRRLEEGCISFTGLKAILAENQILVKDGNSYTTKLSLTVPSYAGNDRLRYVKIRSSAIDSYYGPMKKWKKLFCFYDIDLKEVIVDQDIDAVGERITRKEVIENDRNKI